MGVYVILDGVRREYPEAVRWIAFSDSSITIVGQEERPRLIPGSNYRPNGMVDVAIAQYGRYDLVGWMEEKE